MDYNYYGIYHSMLKVKVKIVVYMLDGNYKISLEITVSWKKMFSRVGTNMFVKTVWNHKPTDSDCLDYEY